MRCLALVALLPWLWLGCSDDTKPATGGDCPASSPSVSTCSVAPDKDCVYPMSLTCPCGFPRGGSSVTCKCMQGEWKCQNYNTVCPPCPDLGLERGVAREASARDQRTEARKPVGDK